MKNYGSTRKTHPSLHSDTCAGKSGSGPGTDDDEFWSSFCDAGEIGCNTPRKAVQSLEKSDIYDDLEHENFFDDDIHLDDSYDLPSAAGIYQAGTKMSDYENQSMFVPEKTFSSGFERRLHTEAPPKPSFGGNHERYTLDNDEQLMSENLYSTEYSSVKKQVPPIFTGRKRIIDEMFDVDDENCSSRKLPRKSSALDGITDVTNTLTCKVDSKDLSNCSESSKQHCLKTTGKSFNNYTQYRQRQHPVTIYKPCATSKKNPPMTHLRPALSQTRQFPPSPAVALAMSEPSAVRVPVPAHGMRDSLDMCESSWVKSAATTPAAPTTCSFFSAGSVDTYVIKSSYI